MWKLQTDEKDKRVYVNSATNSQCEQELLKTDRDGNKWWGFTNLLTMPFTRHMASTKISSLYGLGFTKDDILGIIGSLKNVLNSTDAEMKQKCYSLVLDFESKAMTAIDPVKQMSGLVCVYHTFNDEEIDSFVDRVQLKKMSILEQDGELHAFFLIRQKDLIESYMNRLNLISQTALVQLPELPEVSDLKYRKPRTQNVTRN